MGGNDGLDKRLAGVIIIIAFTFLLVALYESGALGMWK